MKLPSGDRAIIEDRKLLEYVLNPAHPVGRHHAVLFERLLGITARNYGVLKRVLTDAARSHDVVPGRPSQHGTKYEMRVACPGLGGPVTILAVWLVESRTLLPRLVTCYVE